MTGPQTAVKFSDAECLHWEGLFRDFLNSNATSESDSAHDIAHIQRVVKTATRFCESESADLRIVWPAAWLHDCVHVPKNSPDRSRASAMAADAAVDFLASQNFDADLLPHIHHAIHAHSFSAAIACESIEARVLQDADRIDALGAIGIARCFAVGGKLGQQFYSVDDPFCETRAADDSQFTIDHFYVKLLTLGESMQTPSGKAEAQRRTDYMSGFLRQLEQEIS